MALSQTTLVFHLTAQSSQQGPMSALIQLKRTWNCAVLDQGMNTGSTPSAQSYAFSANRQGVSASAATGLIQRNV
jgi:hypothetical protein